MERAVKRVTEKNPDIEFVTRGDKCYLVRGGRSIEVTGEQLTQRLKNEIVGKTVSEFNNMRSLRDLVNDLGLLKKIELESPEEDMLESIFG
jgi:cytidylate kinase